MFYIAEPATVKEALHSSEAKEWQSAMQREIDSIHKYEVWSLVKPPNNCEPIESKWVFKRKLNSGGSVNTHKARLVAKGFSKKKGIDFDETFAPVGRFETVRTLLSLAVEFDLELHQMDVISAFLNGTLEEDIYFKLFGSTRRLHSTRKGGLCTSLKKELVWIEAKPSMLAPGT